MPFLALLLFSGCSQSPSSQHLQKTPVPPGRITEFPLPTLNNSPTGITAGLDGNLWFTVSSDLETPFDRIGRITPSGRVTEFPISNSEQFSGPYEITVGPDSNLWFTGGAFIGRITPSGTITTFPIPVPHSDNFDGPQEIYGIVAGPDGNLWFTEPYAHQIGRITLSGTITTFPIPTSNDSQTPCRITAGPDGNLWFTEPEADQIGRITPNGRVTEFPLPIFGGAPVGIAAGPDGNLWFVGGGSNSTGFIDQIGRITPGGKVTVFPIPTSDGFGTAIGDCFASGITAGPNDNLWFTEPIGQIGCITSGK